MRLNIAVLHVDREPWKAIAEKVQFESWVLQNLRDVSIYYFIAKDSPFLKNISLGIEKMRWRMGRYASYFISYTLLLVFYPFKYLVPNSKEVTSKVPFFSFREVNFPEAISTMRWKRLAIIKHFLNETTDDFLIMITSSSILNLRRIREILESEKVFKLRPETPIVWGPLNESADGIYVSGSFIILNRFGASKLLRNARMIPVHSMDDIAFGVAMRELGFDIRELSSLTILHHEILEFQDSQALDVIPHFRFTSFLNGVRNDTELMKFFLRNDKTSKIFTERSDSE